MTKQIELTQGKFALVNDEDYEYLNQWKWYAAKVSGGKWYAVRGVYVPLRKSVYMHCVIMNPEYKMVIDHVDNDGLNNTRNNLRICTHKENMANRESHKKSNSGYKGVYKISENKYISSIGGEHIGIFTNAIDAAKAYDEESVKKYGKFARPNFKKEK